MNGFWTAAHSKLRFLRGYPAHRVIVAGISFASLSFGAIAIPTETFAVLVSTAFLARFLGVLNLGALSGYLVRRYSTSARMTSNITITDRAYATLLFIQISGLAILVYLGGWVFFDQHLFGVFALLLITPLICLEPIQRYRRNFSFSLLPELVLSTALAFVAIGSFFELIEENSILFYFIVLGIGSLLGLSALKKGSDSTDPWPLNAQISEYLHSWRLGFPVYIGTLFFAIAQGADRLIFPLHGSPEGVAVYFLAMQLAIGSMLLVTATNFVNTVDLGESMKSSSGPDRKIIWSKLRTAATIALGSFIVVVGLAGALERFFLSSDYKGLWTMTLALALGLGVFFVAGSITPVVAYYRRQIPLSIGMAVVALMLITNNVLAYKFALGPTWLAFFSAFCFTIYGLTAGKYTFAVVRS